MDTRPTHYKENCSELIEGAAQYVIRRLPDHPDARVVRESICRNMVYVLTANCLKWHSSFLGAGVGDRFIDFGFVDYSNVWDKSCISETKMSAKRMSKEIDETEEDYIQIFLEWNQPYFRDLAAQAVFAWLFERVDFLVLADLYLDVVN